MSACSGNRLLAGLVFLVLFPAFTNDEDLARTAREKIRPGVLHAERQAAIDLLIGLGEGIWPEVEAMSRSEIAIQRLAALKIFASQRRSAGFFIPFLEDTDYTVRKAALEGVQNALDGGELHGMVIDCLHDPVWSVRRAALGALAAWPLPGTLDAFFVAMQDTDPRVREEAIRLLGELREIPPANSPFGKIVADLPVNERRMALQAVLPLADEKNLSYFKDMAEITRQAENPTTAILFLRVACAVTREVAEHWLELLMDQALGLGDREAEETASTLLALHGVKLIPHLKNRLTREDDVQPQRIVQLCASMLEKEALPVLVDWALDQDLPENARAACIDELAATETRDGARALVRIHPDLDSNLRKQVLSKAVFLAKTSVGMEVEPLLITLLEEETGQARETVYQGLCLLEEPPVELLTRVFAAEQDPAARQTLARKLANAVRENNRDRLAQAFYGELETQGPAYLIAALELSKIADQDLAKKAGERIKEALAATREATAREVLLFALIQLGDPEADRIAAETIETARAEGNPLDEAYLVRHLHKLRGPHTAQLLYRLFREGQEEIRLPAFKTLVQRSDLAIKDDVENVLGSARISYKRALMDDLAQTELAEACKPLLRRMLYQEQEPDLLASVLQVVPISLLREEEERVMEICALGAEAGLDAAEAAFEALAQLDSKTGEAFMLKQVAAFLAEVAEKPDSHLDMYQGEVAMMAALGLVTMESPAAPALVCRLILAHATALRKREILRTGPGKEEATIPGWVKVFPRLLQYEDEVLEKAVLGVIEEHARDGSLYQMGDAVFYGLRRALLRGRSGNKRCPALVERFADLITRCAPAFSSYDLRLQLDREKQAVAEDDAETAADALCFAWHIVTFYPVTGKLIRELLGRSEPFRGYNPLSALASRKHLSLARVLEMGGEKEKAEKEVIWARRRSFFYRDGQ